MDAWQIIVLLGAVIVLYSFIVPRTKPVAQNATANTNKQEIEQVISEFATGLEEENKQLLDLIAEMKQDYGQKTEQFITRIESLERQSLDLRKELALQVQQSASDRALIYAHREFSQQAKRAESAVGEMVSASSQSNEGASADANLKERYKDVFKLYEQGKNVEMIARKLDMNKGEVQLIIQLARREELAGG